MAGNAPAFADAWKIERRAQRIGDPIERLRYLKQATAKPQRRVHGTWLASLALAILAVPLASDALSRQAPAVVVKTPIVIHRQASELPNVWPVEQTNAYDLYSNGLRIENAMQISNQPRSYSLVSRGGTLGPVRTQPAGIVYHSTESDQAPFEADQKSALKRIGQEVLLYVRNKRAYHFVIDRFGRVHRIVYESDTANHAGHSAWADSQWLYVNLNTSFIGVSFEARSKSDERRLTDAQIRSARALTEMLRVKYNIPAENCITHAQVSVNPDNRRVGYHTDWGSGLPFQELGLPNNYEIPNPSVYLFGFESDPSYTEATNPDVWKALEVAEERVRETAAEHGVTTAEYRRILQQRYRDVQTAIQRRSATEENIHESN